MEFKVPGMIMVGGTLVRVELTACIAERLLNGESVYQPVPLIRIDPGLSPALIRRVFIHEALHHITNRYHVELDESQVANLSEGITQVIMQLSLDTEGHISEKENE